MPISSSEQPQTSFIFSPRIVTSSRVSEGNQTGLPKVSVPELSKTHRSDSVQAVPKTIPVISRSNFAGFGAPANVKTTCSGSNIDFTEDIKGNNYSSFSKIHLAGGKLNSTITQKGNHCAYTSLASVPGKNFDLGSDINFKITADEETHSYDSSYVKNFTISSSINQGKFNYNESYGPAAYYYRTTNDKGDVAVDERLLPLGDGDGKEYIHKIDNTPTYNDIGEANKATYDTLKYVSDPEQHGETVSDAWTNPEWTLNTGQGDCEDFAFVLASLARFSLVEPLSEDEVYVGISTFKLEDGKTVGHANVRADAIYEPTGGGKRYWLFPEERYLMFFNDKKGLWR